MLDTCSADVEAHKGAIQTAFIDLCTRLTRGITIKMFLKTLEKSMFQLHLLIYCLNNQCSEWANVILTLVKLTCVKTGFVFTTVEFTEQKRKTSINVC